MRRCGLVGRAVVVLGLVVMMSTVAWATAIRHAPAVRDRVQGTLPLDEVAVLELEAIDREALLVEDEALKADGRAKPLRFALPADLELSPESSGTWEALPEGGWLWRLRVHAPGATDLNFGFSRYALAPGATLHVVSEDHDSLRGPYTVRDVSHAGDFWTPVVAGSRAVLELYEPGPGAPVSELVLGRIGRGYRDLFGLTTTGHNKQGTCNIDVICPEGDAWRDEIRSVARYTVDGVGLCTGTLIMGVPRSFTPYFVTANHCEVRSANASSVVVYWNYESPSCGDLCCGSLAESQSGTIFRAARADNDMCLLELEEDPDPSFNVYFAGFDARTSTLPQATVGIHHPNGDEKAITFNQDAIETGDNCIGPGANTHWWIDDYELGTTEPGSSGSALFDPSTHRVVGYLTGGDASCDNLSGGDCYGKMAVGWDGASSSSRLRDWLDPASTGTRTVAGSNPGGGTSGITALVYRAADSCAAGAGGGNGVLEPGETVQIQVDLTSAGSHSGVQGTLTSQTAGVTVIDGSATFPNITPGAVVTSSAPHFTLQIGQGVACGATVELRLQITSAQGGPYTFTISHPVGGSLEPNVPVAIPDQGTATSTLSVTQNVSLTDVNVRVQVAHSYVGDLTVRLQSPAGTTVTLLDRPGVPASTFGCDNDDMDVTFDDSASTSSSTLESRCTGSSPWYSGSARPVQALSAFNGQGSAGTWRLTVTDASGGDTGTIVDWELITSPSLTGGCQICTGSGPPAANTYVVGGIAHAPGAGGSNWRSKLALLNRSGGAAQVSLDYARASKTLSESLTLANNQMIAWDDVAVSLFGVAGNSSGAVVVGSSRPLIVTARTYNVSSDGTFGQFLPGVDESEALRTGETGVISQLAKSASFRTNIGFVNLSSTTCQVRVTLRSTSGVAIGSQRTVSVPAQGWKQENDIFQIAGAGNRTDAYATVEVLTSGCEVWGYGSVVDNGTGDPTTVPMVVQ